MEIRYMSSADNKAEISAVYEQSWKYAYKDIIPQDYLNAIPKGKWASSLGSSNQKSVVCIDNDKIVGTSNFSKSRFEAYKNWGEIITIYLLPSYIGKGYGNLLIKFVINELEKLGYKNIFLWTLKENLRARKFYEKNGFILTSDILNHTIGGKKLKEVRYIYHIE